MTLPTNQYREIEDSILCKKEEGKVRIKVLVSKGSESSQVHHDFSTSIAGKTLYLSISPNWYGQEGS